MPNKIENSYSYNSRFMAGLEHVLSNYARKKMYESCMDLAKPTSITQVLDVGVTAEKNLESNVFEKYFPHPENITAVGLEDASFLETLYPGLKFVRGSGLQLPFDDQTFDLVLSFAVIEHVGNRSQQKDFLKELLRVGKKCCITTPNRWFPIEFHTGLPFLHWLPRAWFAKILKSLGKDFLSREENLNLLSESNLLELVPAGYKVLKKHLRLFGLVSNLVIYIESQR